MQRPNPHKCTAVLPALKALETLGNVHIMHCVVRVLNAFVVVPGQQWWSVHDARGASQWDGVSIVWICNGAR